MNELSADALYLEHFHFTHDPFAARVPGFKFHAAQRKPVLGQLHHLARYSQLLLAVTGPEGSGKTLLRQALVASTNKESVQSVVVAVQRSTSSAALLQQIAQALGTVEATPEAVLAQVIQLGLTGQEIYLLVDDADRLPEIALAQLLRLAEGQPEGRPHVFLFGTGDLASRLEALSEDQERFHVIELQPYDLGETEEYLAARLEGAGQDIGLLSDAEIEDIHERSGGWPGAINGVARELLIERMQHEQARGAGGRRRGFVMPAWLPPRHVAAVMLVGAVLVGAFLWMGSSEEADVTPQTVELRLPSGTATVAAADPGAPESEPAIEFEGGDGPTPLPLGGSAQPVIREPLADAAAAGDAEDELAAAIEPQSERAERGATVVQAPAPVEAAPAPAPAPAAPAPQPQQTPVVTPSPVPPAPRPSPERAPAPVVQAANGQEWYRTQPSSSFLVQVLGTSSESKARELASGQGGNYRYFTKLHQGKPLYVVTFGSFSDRSSAQRAIDTLPPSLKAGKPWVRTFGSVQQELAGR